MTAVEFWKFFFKFFLSGVDNIMFVFFLRISACPSPTAIILIGAQVITEYWEDLPSRGEHSAEGGEAGGGEGGVRRRRGGGAREKRRALLSRVIWVEMVTTSMMVKIWVVMVLLSLSLFLLRSK